MATDKDTGGGAMAQQEEGDDYTDSDEDDELLDPSRLFQKIQPMTLETNKGSDQPEVLWISEHGGPYAVCNLGQV
ncbi:hypothetical protein EV182_004484, partial [Spiromyces aspiralis]